MRTSISERKGQGEGEGEGFGGALSACSLTPGLWNFDIKGSADIGRSMRQSIIT